MTYASPFYDKDHEEFRAQARRFVEKEISPNIEAWETAGSIPRELHQKAAEAGMLQVGFPERCGGIEVPDLFYGVVLTEELARSGSGGVIAGLMSHGIALPPICHVGSPELQARYARPVLEGRKIAALAITEPGGGSDVANLKTRAERDGDHYVVNGSKTFITSGMRADYLTCAVRTGGAGMGGVSLVVIEGDTPGLSRTPLDKMGWRCSDTATLYFDNCRVPVANLVGRENQGFMAIMLNFNQERIMLAAQAYAFAKVCYDEAMDYARSRETFGKALIRNQVIRHKLVDMRMRLEAVKANLDLVTWRVSNRQIPIAEVCMLKNFACTSLEWIANEAMQVFGGAGYLRGAKVERIYRETKVLTIGGGSLEIMKDLAAKQLGM
ncbi:acyl-CoA dehydrogenase [Panacagrimonas perspica]|uniref:Acyl-CoA dehydrogenase n=1 Tax=Panacagrimonas perspica TaxID=381431 RepID=A0A4R7PF29_9GAMM|nr:acyl-CoA dehydrogenase family protein [Panacagrimonas perspica]TDU32727.1 acyl-CoA dehydrogenase [Panacagrimonas perspica]THD05607.1 acyl-CoA dehydrogenase [Panacagrimonas perspica]